MPQLLGIQAKIDRAIEQLEALHREVLNLRDDPHAWTIVQGHNTDGTKHFIRFDPRWQAGTAERWGVIAGEIIHDLRSALDHLVFQVILLNERTPDRWHWFPILGTEPSQGFVAATTWVQPDKHGPLTNVSREALALIEGCQPYKGGDRSLLRLLNELWRTDKHRHLLPMLVVSELPKVEVINGELVEQRLERDERGANVLHVTVKPTGNAQPEVNVKPQPPLDIAFAGGVPVVDVLNDCARFILTDVFEPASGLFRA